MIPTKSGEAIKVLLVEDDMCLETSVSRVIRKVHGSPQITWTTTGEDALDVLSKESFDLIIVDYTLAGMTNGLYVWEQCQRLCPRVPFILMSGLPVQNFLDMTHEFYQRPRFLPKPFLPNELSLIVQESLSKSHPGVLAKSR